MDRVDSTLFGAIPEGDSPHPQGGLAGGFGVRARQRLPPVL